MKIIITGGHFSPAYALIQSIRKKHDVVVVGRKYAFEGDSTVSFEYETCKKIGINFIPITTGRLQRKWTRYTIPSLLKIPKGHIGAIGILKKQKPDVVVSFGGYIALPIALAAKLLNIPLLLHEQTLHSGVANKIIARFADVICVSYEGSKKFFPKNKTILTGLPLRHEIFEEHHKLLIPKGRTVLYVTGGSTGSHAINAFIQSIVSELLRNYVVIHQTGDSDRYHDFQGITALKKSLPESLSSNYIVKKYLLPEEVGDVYAVSDVVISRSGANTVAELLALGKKAVLIPLPGGQAGEQFLNAEYFISRGLGVVISQNDLNKGNFLSALKKIERLSQHVPQFQENATELLVRAIEDLYEKKKHKEKS